MSGRSQPFGLFECMLAGRYLRAKRQHGGVALISIIEQAGGVVTTFDGGPAENGGDILAAATPQLHEAAMAALRG